MTAVREERRLVTCMFVDVVGSTELVTKMGAERLKRELGNAFTEISTVIASHGGTVEKYIGDAVYALFGAPTAHEDDPLRALRAAEAVRERCARGDQHGHPFAVRIGVETGEAVVDLEAAETTKQQMSVGPVVNIAARLQQRAEPGDILVGPAAREATEAGAECEPLGEIDLKGIGPLPVWRLVRTGATRARSLRFVGREAELALLGHAHDRAVKGRSVLAVVSGPPGQGKTRLVQEFLGSRSAGSHVITTRCRPPEEVGVFAPVREILGVTTLDALAEQVGRICADDLECERVVAGLAESAGIATSRSLSALPAAERDDEVVQAWRRYLGLLGQERLVILAVDDVHWADASMVRLIDRITFGGPRVLVVATARPEFAETAGIRPSGDRFFIELEGLEPADAKRLAGLAGRDDERVVERAEGNPLFLVELARAGERGELPLTLQGALGARLDQLAAPDRSLLSFAAVAGERFTASDAAYLVQRDPVDVGRALAHLADLHFLDLTDRGYRFHHGLVRDAAYGRLLTAERMKAHARFARERAHPEDVETLAYHWWEALRPPDAEWVWAADPALPEMRRDAFRALLGAGQRHADHFAAEPAVVLLSRAKDLAVDDAERALVERALGNAYRRVLRQDEAWEHLLRALAAFRATGEVPIPLYVELLETTYYIGAFKTKPPQSEVDAIATEGVAAARAAGDLRSVALMRRAQAGFSANRFHKDLGRAEALIDEAVEAARASGDPETQRIALLARAAFLSSAGRPLARSAVAELEPRSGDALDRLQFLRIRAGHEFREGDLSAALETMLEASELVVPMGPHNRTHAWAPLADLYLATGRWENVMEIAHRTAQLVRESPASAFCSAAPIAMRDGAIAHALAGSRDEADALLRAMPRGDFEPDLIAMLPRALLGLRSPQSDVKLDEKRWGWWEWEQAALRAVVFGNADKAEEALREIGPIAENTPTHRAFAEAIHEAIVELRGGPPATYAPLTRLGMKGWVEILKRRVDAEY